MMRISRSASTRVCVIGGGAAGLISSQVLKDCGISFKCYEKSSYCGGVWNYWGNAKTSGNPMYKSLRTNLPREVMPFHSHFRFKDDEVSLSRHSPLSITNKYRSEIDSYIDLYDSKRTASPASGSGGGAPDSFLSHLEVQCYLERFADENDLHSDISYNTEVISCTKNPSSTQWTVKTRTRVHDGNDEGKGEVQEDLFDYVIVANGHYNRPFVPFLPGMSAYTGIVQHSADYDGPVDLYRGKTVLVVGGRSSATDLAREISTLANRVYVSDRNYQRDEDVKGEELGPRGNLFYIGGLDRVDVDGSTFVSKEGGRIEGVDVIVWCTGFLYDFPFLSASRETVQAEGDYEGEALFTTNGRKVQGLYEHLFSATDPSLSFVGLPFSIVPFPFFYVQALWIASTINGDSVLPPLEERLAWVDAHEMDLRERNMNSDSKYHYLGDKQWEYNRRVAGYAFSGKGSSDDDHEKCLSAICDYDSLIAFLDLSEAIYTDNSQRRPLLGYPDLYRGNKYIIESEIPGRYSVEIGSEVPGTR